MKLKFSSWRPNQMADLWVVVTYLGPHSLNWRDFVGTKRDADVESDRRNAEKKDGREDWVAVPLSTAVMDIINRRDRL